MAQGQRSRSGRDNRTWTWSPGLGLRTRHPPLPQTRTETLGGGPTRVGNEGGGSLSPNTQSNSCALPEAWRPHGTLHSATRPEDSRCPDGRSVRGPAPRRTLQWPCSPGPALPEPRAHVCPCLGCARHVAGLLPEHAACCRALTCEASPGPAQAPQLSPAAPPLPQRSSSFSPTRPRRRPLPRTGTGPMAMFRPPSPAQLHLLHPSGHRLSLRLGLAAAPSGTHTLSPQFPLSPAPASHAASPDPAEQRAPPHAALTTCSHDGHVAGQA